MQVSLSLRASLHTQDPKVDWWMFARYAFIYLSCVLLFGGAVRRSSLVVMCALDTHSTSTHMPLRLPCTTSGLYPC